MPVEDGDSFLKLLRGVFRPEVEFSMYNGSYYKSQEQVAYFLTQEAAHLLVHFKETVRLPTASCPSLTLILGSGVFFDPRRM